MGDLHRRRVIQFLEELLRVAFLEERRRRADIDTLAAGGAHALLEGHVISGHHHRLKTAVRVTERVDPLNFRTDAHAPAAEDALIGVADNRHG